MVQLGQLIFRHDQLITAQREIPIWLLCRSISVQKPEKLAHRYSLYPIRDDRAGRSNIRNDERFFVREVGREDWVVTAALARLLQGESSAWFDLPCCYELLGCSAAVGQEGREQFHR